MAYNFLARDRDQAFLLPPDLREWLPTNHVAWFMLDVVDQLDLHPFLAAYRADGHGRAAYQPRMLLAVLLYAYCTGVRSSRQIERRCHEDIAVRILAGNSTPDHVTIARFRVRHEQALAGLLVQSLRLCAAAGPAATGQGPIGSRWCASDFLAGFAAIRDREFDLEQEQRPGPVETRLQLVLAVLAHEMTVAEAARRHGVSAESINRWRNRFVDAGKAAMEDGMPGKAGSRGSLVERRQRAEIQELKLALAEATVQLRIWQKGSEYIDQVPSPTSRP